MDAVVVVRALRKTYGDVVAVDELNLEVERGTVFGLLGPNGAGKTTSLELIQGLRSPDSGTVEVLGFNPWRDHYRLMQRIGIQLQASTLFPRLTVTETLRLFAAYYDGRCDVDGVISLFSLTEKPRSFVKALSGGQRQRLSMALAFLNDPEVALLDEPTAGLDAQSRLNLWDLIREYRGQGKTILLATHNMDEAQELCDKVAIIDHGRILALDSPVGLIKQHCRAASPGGEPLNVDLEDVFLSLTGRRLRD